jgi:hypothetical protein
VLSHLERDVFPLGVSVTLLLALVYLQILSDLGDIFFSFDNGGGTEKGLPPTSDHINGVQHFLP